MYLQYNKLAIAYISLMQIIAELLSTTTSMEPVSGNMDTTTNSSITQQCVPGKLDAITQVPTI